MACTKAHRLHVSDTPLKNASAQGLCVGRPRDAVGISEQLQLFHVYEMVGTSGATSRGNSSLKLLHEKEALKLIPDLWMEDSCLHARC